MEKVLDGEKSLSNQVQSNCQGISDLDLRFQKLEMESGTTKSHMSEEIRGFTSHVSNKLGSFGREISSIREELLSKVSSIDRSSLRPQAEQSIDQLANIINAIPSDNVYKGGKSSIKMERSSGTPSPSPSKPNQLDRLQDSDAPHRSSRNRGRDGHRTHRRRQSDSSGSESKSRSPPRPKLDKFTGEKGTSTIEAFLFQYERLTNRRNWSSTKKTERLFDYLGGAALEFAKRLHSFKYSEVVHQLSERFSTKPNPRTARRELSSIKQNEDEALEEFSQRVYTLTLDGFQDSHEDTVDQLSTESFLRGVRDKEAARHVLEKDPGTVNSALKQIKEYQANNRAIYGSQKGYSQRAVHFSGETNLDEKIQESLQKMMSKLEGSLGISLGRKEPRSPRPYPGEGGGNRTGENYQGGYRSPRQYGGRGRQYGQNQGTPPGRYSTSPRGRSPDRYNNKSNWRATPGNSESTPPQSPNKGPRSPAGWQKSPPPNRTLNKQGLGKPTDA